MIIVNQQPIDLGRLPVNQTKTFSVPVTNASKETVTITTTPYCSSCTTSKVLKSNLKAGESTSVELKFTPTKIGANHKVVGLNVNGKEQAKINFKAEVY